MLHVSPGDWNPASANLPPTTLNIRHLQLSHAGLRIGTEDNILHFPEGVLMDDVIGAGLVGKQRVRLDNSLHHIRVQMPW
jgi:hypothetical protein